VGAPPVYQWVRPSRLWGAPERESSSCFTLPWGLSEVPIILKIILPYSAHP